MKPNHPSVKEILEWQSACRSEIISIVSGRYNRFRAEQRQRIDQVIKENFYEQSNDQL